MNAADWIKKDKTVKQVSEKKETVFINPLYLPFETTKGVCDLVVSDEDIADAAARLDRFAPFIEKCFPETKETHAQDGQPPCHCWIGQGPRRYL